MNTVARFTLGVLFAGALAVPSLASSQDKSDAAKSAKGSPSMQMHMDMMKGMKEMQGMKPTGNVDHDFAMMMRHHHQQGVRMAQMQLQNGKDAKMREMAQKIVDSQKQEIAEFDKWLSEHGASMKK